MENIKKKLEWLESHNKNYTKEQYHTICDLLEMVEGLQDSIAFWTDLADKRRKQLEIAKKTLESIANYSEHAENDCCGGLSESALHEMDAIEIV